MKITILLVVCVLGAAHAKPSAGMEQKDMELLEACAEYEKRGFEDGSLKELCAELAEMFKGSLGVTDDYKRSATDDYKRGATDDYKRSATDDYKRGGTDDYKRGATDDYKRGATDDYKRGATDDYKRGATDDYKRGVTDDKRSYTYGVTGFPSFTTEVPDWFWEWFLTYLFETSDEDFDKKTVMNAVMKRMLKK